MNNDQNLLDKKNNLIFKKIIKIITIIILAIVGILILDFFYTTIFKQKPIIIIGQSENKYSSILYDVYICGNEYIMKSKTEKYSCQEFNLDNDNSSINSDTKNEDKTGNNYQDEISKEPTANDTSNQNIDDKDSNDNSIIEGNSSSSDNSNIKENISTSPQNKITIEDRSSDYCAQAIEYYYEDDNYHYYFTCIKSSSVYVIKDGKEYTIKYALNNNIVTMNELIEAGFKPLKESKNLVDR